MNIESLARPEIVAMKPYSSARKEAPGRGILLNANEAPWPLLETGDSAAGLNRYPDPQPAELVRRLAGLYGVSEEMMLVTRGSDEGIDLLTRVFCRAGEDAILQSPPTFGMYRIAAQTQGAKIVSVARLANRQLAIDEDRLLDTLGSDQRIKLVFMTSPNNPTGDIVETAFLRRLLQAADGRALVVVDEAYAEFCEQPSATDLLARFDNLVVLRTMSKAWASAGLRCGTVLANPAVIDLLRRVIAPYPLPSPVVGLALSMLSPEMMDRQKDMLARLARNKRLLVSMLEKRNCFLEIMPGEANFVLLRVKSPDELLSFCASQNVILRGFPADPALQGWIRISVGSAEEIAALSAVLDDWEKRN
jgi:histidinol-phosphate aminotransferase